MTYSEAVDYILDIPKFTKKNALRHTRTAFSAERGRPSAER